MEPSFGKQDLVWDNPDIAALQERIAKLEEQLTQDKQESVAEREKVEILAKKEISDYVREVQQTPSFALPQSTRDDTAEIGKLPPSEQVGALVSLALSTGLSKSLAVANGLNNPAFVDELHDVLVDGYFDQLVQMGVIKLG